jgi:hypothetical protein
LIAVAGTSGSQAAFNAQVGNPASRYAFTALYAPSSLTATPSGHDVNLGWNAGTNGSGYNILGVNNGASNNCSGASFSSISSTSGTSYADTGRYTPQGTWFCYQAQTAFASWTSVNSNPTAAAQLGVVATSVAAANGGTAGKLDSGDTITVTFNQPISTGTGPAASDTTCAVNGNTILLATTTLAGACATSESVDLGKLSGGSSNKNARWNATYTWSNAGKTLTVTLGVLRSGNAPPISGIWTLNPTTTPTKLLSTASSYHTCDSNTGGGFCLPTLTGSF